VFFTLQMEFTSRGRCMMAKTVLCHCEDIEVEELYSALEQGYGDLETLKRYTGIGTGKCQGKCCLVQTLRLLATIQQGSPHAGVGDLMGDPGRIRLPTIRPPVLPIRINDIIETEEDPQ
jgi:bacterioferritin-associated ferredoxin